MNLRRWFSLPSTVLLVCQSAAAAKYANTTTEDVTTTIVHVTSTKFITEIATSRLSGVAAVTSAGGLQIMDARFYEYLTYTWTQKYNATTVGTVQIIINEATNKTTTTTKYHTEYKSNSTGTDSVAILSRTDIDAAGTVTAVVQDLFNSSTTITYPTPYLQYTDSIMFHGTGATVIDGQGTCCRGTWFESATPTHEPFPSLTPTLDAIDPSGWLYVIFTGWGPGSLPTYDLVSTEIKSLFGKQIQMTTTQCTYKSCTFPAMESVAPASWAIQQVGIFATETTTLSIPKSSSSFTSIADPITGSAASSIESSAEDEPSASEPPATTTSPTALPAIVTSDTAQVSTTDTPANTPTNSPSSGNPPVVSNSQSDDQQPSASNPPQETATQPNEASSSTPSSFAPETTQSAAPPAIIIGGSTVTQGSNSEFVVGSQTLVPGSSIVVGSGSSTTVVALQTDGVVVVGSSSSLIQPQVTQAAESLPPQIVVGDSTVIQQSDSAFIIGSQTLTPGGAITIGSGTSATVVALASNAASAVLQEGSSSVVIPVVTEAPVVSFSTPAPAIVIGGSTLTEQSGSAFVLSGQTLVPGSEITIGSQVVKLQSDDSSLVLQVGTSTEVFQIPSAVPVTYTSPYIHVAGSTITAQSGSTFVISGQTLTPGGTITVGTGSTAEVIALEATGSQLVAIYDGTLTSTLAAAAITPASVPSIVVGDSTITAKSGSTFVISGQTLTPGGTITVGAGSAAEVVALQTSGSQLFVVYDGISTSTLSAAQITPGPLPAFTFDGSVVSADSASAYVFDGHTLTPGDDIVVDGTTISLASDASELIIGTSTINLAATTTSDGLAGYIWSAFDAETTSGSNNTVLSTSSKLSTTSPRITSTAPRVTSSAAETAATTTSTGQILAIPLWFSMIVLALAMLQI